MPLDDAWCMTGICGFVKKKSSHLVEEMCVVHSSFASHLLVLILFLVYLLANNAKRTRNMRDLADLPGHHCEWPSCFLVGAVDLS